jgi:hypothetical protein
LYHQTLCLVFHVCGASVFLFIAQKAYNVSVFLFIAQKAYNMSVFLFIAQKAYNMSIKQTNILCSYITRVSNYSDILETHIL